MGDEAELVERVRAGDEDAFAAVVRQYHARLLRLAESVVGSRAVADEVVQDTWLAVVRGIERFEGRSSFKTWLFHILLNRARSAAGKERRDQPLPAEDHEAGRFNFVGGWKVPPAPWADEVDDRITAEQLAGRLREMLADLPEAQRQVLILRDIEGIAAGEVATLVGVSDGNQRVLLHRARSRLRARLELEMGAT